MLKKIMMLSAIAAALTLTVALPADAFPVPTTGPRISILNPPTTYPANAPFFVLHGFSCFAPPTNSINASDCANASTKFVLHVDGVQQPSQKDIETGIFDGTPFIAVAYLTNFPQGLPAGTHTLTGDWYFDGNLVGEHSATITFT